MQILRKSKKESSSFKEIVMAMVKIMKIKIVFVILLG